MLSHHKYSGDMLVHSAHDVKANSEAVLEYVAIVASLWLQTSAAVVLVCFRAMPIATKWQRAAVLLVTLCCGSAA
jgi:hypothetical protein